VEGSPPINESSVRKTTLCRFVDYVRVPLRGI